MTYTIKCPDGRRWKVREAVSLTAACSAIAFAKSLGSIGSRSVQNDTHVGGGIYTLADVIQINSDGTERQPYTAAY